MTSQKRYLGLFIAGVSALAVVGCSHPNAMPSGYTHHHKAYKSPDPAPSSRVTTQQRQYMDAAQAEQFRSAIYDLLERLTNRAGMPPKPVYILAPQPMTTFYANIDNDLRESMRHIGYALSDISTSAYVFAYDARVLEQPRGSEQTGAANVELVLKVFDSIGENARMLSEESGRYFIQGAETLNIRPASYANLPERSKIMLQAQGMEKRDMSYTRSQVAAPVPAMTSAPSVARPVSRAEISSPSISAAPPSSTFKAAPAPVLRAPEGVRYDGPTQGITIDSNGVSYAEEPVVNDRPAAMRARVSKQVEY